MPTQPQESQAPRVAVPELSLPREGKISGYGETFQPDSFTGTAQISFPIPLSAARDAEPALALAYGSGQGNGPFGLGFALDLPAISVRTDKGIPRYDGHDTFLLGGEPLVPRYDRDGEGWKRDERTVTLDGVAWRVEGYRPRTEQSFSRIERWTRNTGDTAGESFWRLTDGEDRTSIFGRNAGARVADPVDPRRVYQWLLEETADSHGNRALYRYKREDGAGLPDRIYDAGHELRANLYPERILYGNYQDDAGNEQFALAVLFDYGEYDLEPPVLEPVRPWPARPDGFSTFRPGFEVRTCRLCRNVLMLHRFPEELGPGPCLVGALRLRYDENPVASRLTAIQRVGYSRTEETGGERYLEQALPPAELAYTPFAPEEQRLQPLEVRAPGLLPGAPGQPGYQMVDLYGDGLAGILYQEGETLLYWRPLGEAAYDPPVPLPLAPSEHEVSGLATSGVTLMDVAGNGHLDVVVARTGRGGFYRNHNDGGWSPYRDFAAYTPEMANPRAELVDVSGEGVADLLVPNPGSFTYYPLLGDDGFGTPGAGDVPDGFPPVGSGAGPVFTTFADLFGDGLAHRIRLRSGLTEVWPNLGYGRFGERILLGNTPQLANLSPERVFLADVDGSGTADLVVLFTDHANVYLNQSGNAWSEPIRVPLPCGVDVLDTASVADVFGTGSPALVIGKPGPVPRQFVFDFAGGRRPHLLESYRDNLGSARRLAYRSSTSYFLAARRAGNPWVTKLAFPVQVVAEAEFHDEIADRRSRQVFQYRDGYYDPLERELRGFAYVEAVEIRDVPPGEQPAVQPALTRTWNDTGAWMEQEALLRQMREESFQGDPLALTLPAAVLAPDIATGPAHAANTVREAHRALKGSPLRSERYALDGSGADPGPLGAPLSVTQTTYAVTLVQPPLDGHPGVFHVTMRESAESVYEGTADDPRIAHSFTLEVDGFGNVRRAASVAYPRRPAPGRPDLPAQQRLLGTVILADFFNHPGEDFYRLGLAWQERQLELGGLSPGDGRRYFTFDEIRAQVEQALADPLPYGRPFTPGAVQSRLFAHQRSRYWDAGLAAPLPFGETTAQALLYDHYSAVFPPAYVTEVYGARVTAEDLEQRAGYRQADGLWWNPGSVAFYDGAARFYQVRAARDPFGQTTEIRHDRYCLVVTEIVAPLGQETRARIDYQALQPSAVTDVNGNVAEAIYGPLGQPVALSLHGVKDGSPVGNMSLDGYVFHPDATTEAVLADPAKYLQGASLYRLYDVQSWWRSARDRRQPVHEVVLERERWLHPEPGKGPDEATPIRVSLTYLDGEERSLCRKIKVEAAALEADAEGYLWLTPDQVVYDQVKEPVRRFNPFFTAGPAFQADPDSPFARQFYDAAGRLRRTDGADGSWEETRYAAWAERYWDADDTDPDSPFYDTPATHALDVLGRAFLETRVNLVEVDGKTERRELSTGSWLDVAGNRLRVADPRFYDPAKPAEPAHYNFVDAYAMGGQRLASLGADDGSRLTLQDAMGKTVLAWNGRGLRLATRYDALRRPVEVRLTGGGPDLVDLIAERFEYGTDPERNNRGRVVRHDDPAGVLRTPDYDLLGKAVREERQVARDYTTPVDWSRPDGVPLLPDVWRTTTTCDALGQAVSQTNADGSRIEPAYYLSGWLSRSRVRLPGEDQAWTVAGPLRYGAAGQVAAMPLANGVSCERAYDPRNLRLVGVAASREVGRGGGGGTGEEPLQDLGYRYDRVGNVTRVEDALQTAVFFRNREVQAVRELVYDALYQLRSATGRQQAAGTSPNNGQALEPYLERYDYDASGNLTRIRHTAPSPDGNWTRDVVVSDSSNRAVPKSMLTGGKRPDDFFDGDGNLLELEHLRALTWNPFDQLAEASVIERQDGPSDAVWFVYDAAGNRVRKVLQRYAHGGELIETIDTFYLGDVLVTRQSADSGGGTPRVTSEATALRISAGGHCVLLTEKESTADRTFRYQLDDALGSVSLELDEQARIITYEEYFPYGGTALIGGASQAEVERKRYRFTGKELDRATGLYDFGARYYIPWLGRWLNPDPSGPVDGLNLYEYVGNNPVSYLDPDGRVRILQSAAAFATGGANAVRSLVSATTRVATTTLSSSSSSAAAATTTKAVALYRRPESRLTLYRRPSSAVAVTSSYRAPETPTIYYVKVGAYSKAPNKPLFIGAGHGHAFVETGIIRGNTVVSRTAVGVSAQNYQAAYGAGTSARLQSIVRLAREGTRAVLHEDSNSFAQPETVSVTFRISRAEFLAAGLEISYWKEEIRAQRFRYSLAYQCASFAQAVAFSAGVRELYFGTFFANPKALGQSLRLLQLGLQPNPYAEGARGIPLNLARRIIGSKKG